MSDVEKEPDWRFEFLIEDAIRLWLKQESARIEFSQFLDDQSREDLKRAAAKLEAGGLLVTNGVADEIRWHLDPDAPAKVRRNLFHLIKK